MVRTCCGCGQQARKDEMVRLILNTEGQLMLDLQNNAAGRGAYLHPEAVCWQAKRVGGLLARSLRCKALQGQKPEQLKDQLEQALRVAMAGPVGSAAGGGEETVRVKLLELGRKLSSKELKQR